ncbi:MCA1 [Symbiodinium natans]|uniref:MCA1 protein n=1 Tax=Symbiodinium natans TaxID=878477 RepID=A0A812TM27_9DINO|nr:MCA1 [Symbiodinium natans]
MAAGAAQVSKLSANLPPPTEAPAEGGKAVRSVDVVVVVSCVKAAFDRVRGQGRVMLGATRQRRKMWIGDGRVASNSPSCGSLFQDANNFLASTRWVSLGDLATLPFALTRIWLKLQLTTFATCQALCRTPAVIRELYKEFGKLPLEDTTEAYQSEHGLGNAARIGKGQGEPKGQFSFMLTSPELGPYPTTISYTFTFVGVEAPPEEDEGMLAPEVAGSQIFLNAQETDGDQLDEVPEAAWGAGLMPCFTMGTTARLLEAPREMQSQYYQSHYGHHTNHTSQHLDRKQGFYLARVLMMHKDLWGWALTVHGNKATRVRSCGTDELSRCRFQQLYQPYSPGYAYQMGGSFLGVQADEARAASRNTGNWAEVKTVGVQSPNCLDLILTSGAFKTILLELSEPPGPESERNISAALQWLVKGAGPGDHLLFHYSGHGSQKRDMSGEEADGKDETIVPCDFNKSGMITDDELRRMLVDGLPKGCRLTVIMDCCHSAGHDVKTRTTTPGIRTLHRRRRHPSEAEVVLLSGCKDFQTSSDISGGIAGNRAAGAMTTAFRKIISKKKSISYHHLLLEMRNFLKQQGFDQVPQLCMEFHLNFEESFLPEADPPVAQLPTPLRSTQRRALTIGINYFSLTPGQGRLSGCINDSETMITVLKDTFKFEDSQICRLRDDHTNMMPTKANILAAMRWLTQGVGSGDELFLHYSGHGGRADDRSGDELTGKDDTLIPCDFQSAGQISDDELHSLLVEHLPAVQHSGTSCCHCLSLCVNGKGGPSGAMRPPQTILKNGADIVVPVVGQPSRQTERSGSLAPKAAGAMTTAFRHVISPAISCEDLLLQMRHFLQRNSFSQVDSRIHRLEEQIQELRQRPLKSKDES